MAGQLHGTRHVHRQHIPALLKQLATQALRRAVLGVEQPPNSLGGNGAERGSQLAAEEAGDMLGPTLGQPPPEQRRHEQLHHPRARLRIQGDETPEQRTDALAHIRVRTGGQPPEHGLVRAERLVRHLPQQAQAQGAQRSTRGLQQVAQHLRRHRLGAQVPTQEQLAAQLLNLHERMAQQLDEDLGPWRPAQGAQRGEHQLLHIGGQRTVIRAQLPSGLEQVTDERLGHVIGQDGGPQQLGDILACLGLRRDGQRGEEAQVLQQHVPQRIQPPEGLLTGRGIRRARRREHQRPGLTARVHPLQSQVQAELGRGRIGLLQQHRHGVGVELGEEGRQGTQRASGERMHGGTAALVEQVHQPLGRAIPQLGEALLTNAHLRGNVRLPL
jgi:hypothetical protein